MLDNDFLRSIGIQDDLLPEDGDFSDFPLAGEFMVPPEIWDLSEEELKSFIMERYSQDNPYKCMTPQGHVIAVYPHSGEGRYDLEFTVDELVVMMRIIRDSEAKVTAYQPRDGSWVSC